MKTELGLTRVRCVITISLLSLVLLLFEACTPMPGQQVWVQRYDGPASGDDRASAIAVDSSGNIYVTGFSTGIATAQDYATIKYDPDGNQVWVQRYNGPGNDLDIANAIAMDSSGYVYVTGGSTGSGTRYDYATIKYDRDGNEMWVRRYNGPGNSDDAATAISLDSTGNVYVTGYSLGSGTGGDYATIKYDPNGNEMWVQRYNGPGNDNDTAHAIALDSAGNIYVTGGSYGSGTSSDYASVKYDAAGNQMWVRQYDGPTNSGDEALAMAIDSSDNIYVTGYSHDASSSVDDSDYATVKYDSAGNEKWVTRYDGPGNNLDWAWDIATDSGGNIYVTGVSLISATDGDYATIKYDPNGNEMWVQRYNGPGNGYDQAYAMAIDSNDNTYVTGWSTVSASCCDYGTVKYDRVGNEKWARFYNGSGNASEQAVAIAIDSAGNIYVTGSSAGSGTGDDYATIKYTP